jgi:hypothetical protein
VGGFAVLLGLPAAPTILLCQLVLLYPLVVGWQLVGWLVGFNSFGKGGRDTVTEDTVSSVILVEVQECAASTAAAGKTPSTACQLGVLVCAASNQLHAVAHCMQSLLCASTACLT